MNVEHIRGIKVAIAAAVAWLTALWGWFGWFAVLLGCCMVLDYATGTASAVKNGKWSSRAARDGLWHKLSIVIAVTVACILDVVLGMALNNIPAIELPFTYSVLFGPIVVAWYILTELGSILENAGKLGARQPSWFKKAIAAMEGGVDKAGDKIIPEAEDKTTKV